MLEEALQLVEVAVGGGQEAGRIRLGSLGAGDRAQGDLQLIAEALDAALHAHEVPALEAPGEQIGVAEGAREDRAGAVAQLDGQIGGAGARELALLA